MAFCENCGKTVEPGIKFCENCGVPIDDPSTTQPTNSQEPTQAPTFQESPAPTAPPASSPIPPIYIAVGVAVVVIIIALVFASGAMSGPPDHVVPPTVRVTPTTSVTTLPATTMVVPGSGPVSDWNSKGVDLSKNGDYQGGLYVDEKVITLDTTLYVNVFEKTTNVTAIPYASVFVNGALAGKTGNDGIFTFSHPGTSPITVKVMKTGYESWEEEVGMAELSILVQLKKKEPVLGSK